MNSILKGIFPLKICTLTWLSTQKLLFKKKIKFVNLYLKKGITDSAECYLLKEIKKKNEVLF